MYIQILFVHLNNKEINLFAGVVKLRIPLDIVTDHMSKTIIDLIINSIEGVKLI